MSQDDPKPRGRPPSKAARRKALDAAHAILMDEGFGRLTMEAVAARSGVGKPTIYRNWANASELAMAALIADLPEEEVDGTKLHDALSAQIGGIVRAFATTRGRQIAVTLAAADPESEMTRAFRNRVILTSRETGRRLIEQAAARGEISFPTDIDVVLDMAYGPVFYRLLLGHLPLNPEFAAALVVRTCRALTPVPAPLS
ncbi:TetR/AcrR family transcriptional regulator [Pseudoruegeria sp. HB172150]|uniref:TetR/AcrR family transcriptional regulator n=1 Tax=Pseudoruegeria sp. HB172150 TaxID=2721164 RepID=UPI001557ECDE|nr:TetR/AcrR family transcriptional regulator [Pseudoruegeria sp. HB172150]